MLDGNLLGNNITNAILDSNAPAEGKTTVTKFWIKIATEIVNHIKSMAIVLSSGIPTVGHSTTSTININGLDGNLLGNNITNAILDSNAPAEGKTTVTKFWIKIATEIVNHIMDMGKINAGISTTCGPVSATISNGQFVPKCMNGNLLGNNITNAILDSNAPAEGKTMVTKFWIKIATEIVNHIMDMGQVPPGIAGTCSYSSKGCNGFGSLTATGKII